MLIEPASESAGLAGVGTFVTSIRARLLIDIWLKSKKRELPLTLEVLAN